MLVIVSDISCVRVSACRVGLLFCSQLSLTVKKKMGFIWVHIPCMRKQGSCTYENICEKISHFDCPPIFKKYGIPCRCPVAPV